MEAGKGSFKELQFENTASKELRIDPNNSNETRQVDGYHYSLTPITGLANPKIVGISKPACQLLDLDPEKLKGEADYLIGNKTPATAKVNERLQSLFLTATSAISSETLPDNLEMEELSLLEISETAKESSGIFSSKVLERPPTPDLQMEELCFVLRSESSLQVSICTFWVSQLLGL